MARKITPSEFVAKWPQIQQKETAVSQSHFNDICRLVGRDDNHTALAHALLDAYTWPHNLTDEQILERLLALNLERAAKQEKK